tara:strand:+ start:257 stop:766 length:510 start_codon:yes stop_codon:yes gene_type:complete
MDRKNILLDRCEAMSLLTIKSSYHWNFIKQILSFPVIVINSILCILNSFDDKNMSLKIPNVIINGISVLIMSITTNLKSAEKTELFKNASNSFLILTHEIEGIGDIDNEKINILQDKYDAIITSIPFEDIPKKIKLEIATNFKSMNKSLPIQINGNSIINYELQANMVV